MIFVVFHSSDTQGYETLLASSADLLHWNTLGTILPFRSGAWDSTQAAGYIALQNTDWNGDRSLLQYDNKYWLSYIGGSTTGYEAGMLSIGVANTTTPDQAHPWNRYDHPVLSPTDSDARSWEKTKLYKSNIIYDPQSSLGAPYVIYYNATTNDNTANSGIENIGMATSSDLLTWKRYSTDPVVSPPDTGYANRVCGDPQIVKIGDTWTMFFWARFYGDSGTKVFNSFACSYDLINWKRWQGEVLMTTTRPYERTQAIKPWIIKDNQGIVYQFYRADGDNGDGIAVATSQPLNATPGKIYAGASYTYLKDDPQQAIDGTVSYTVSPSNRWTAYNSPNAADWLQIQFPTSRSISGVALYIYNDGQSVHPPSSYDVQYYDGGAQGSPWISTPNQSKTPATPTAELNVDTFNAVTTNSIRVFFTHQGNGSYSGVTEMLCICTFYEAEEGQVTDADVRQSSSAFSGRYIGGINNTDSNVKFIDVYAPSDGNHTLTVFYANATSGNSTHNLSVNGGNAITVTYPPTGTWGQFNDNQSVQVSVPLQKGANTLTFSKGDSYAELDKIQIS
jgi:hypothetical protein